MADGSETEFTITREMFFAATGFEPEQDDLERCNCTRVGSVGHTMCGWDRTRNMPNFIPIADLVRDPS